MKKPNFTNMKENMPNILQKSWRSFKH